MLCISCNLKQDDASDCPNGVWVKLKATMDVEYGSKYNDQSFANDLDNIILWVFDEKGVFIEKHTARSETLKQNDNTMYLDMDPGNYKMVVWTGTADTRYEVTNMIPSTSTIEELKVRVARDVLNRRSGKLSSLWHGHIEDVVVKRAEYTYVTIELLKNTNTVIAVLQDISGNDFNSNDYSFEIIADNGYMDYDNNLLPDEWINYNAYLIETATVSDENARNETTNVSVARAELNTLRLMADKSSRFVVTNKEGVAILDINLTAYLLLTREYYIGSNGAEMSPQGYLDYEDMYRIIFFLSPTGNSANPYLCTSLKINGWIVRLNDQEF